MSNQISHTLKIYHKTQNLLNRIIKNYQYHKTSESKTQVVCMEMMKIKEHNENAVRKVIEEIEANGQQKGIEVTSQEKRIEAEPRDTVT